MSINGLYALVKLTASGGFADKNEWRPKRVVFPEEKKL
jgi:hypothetical protein